MEINEKHILANCQAGKLEEFGKIYEKYVKKIYNFTYYKTSSREVAEDLTSQAFFKALSRIDQFDTSGSFSAWIYTIARNGIIDYYRSNHPQSNIEDAFDLVDGTNIERDIDAKEDLKKVKEYIKSLNSTQREILMLRIWEGMSYKEIADITGKSETNCRIIFSRAISKVREQALLALFIIIFLS